MFCPMCGAPNDDDSIFCGNCGAVMDPDNAPDVDEAAEDLLPAETATVEAELDGGQAVPEPNHVPEQPAPPTPPAPHRAHPTGPSVPTSGMAIASLVLGIGGLTVLPLIGSILAILFGYMARRDIRQRPDAVSGDGLALAGIVLGWISVGLAVVGLLIFGGVAACGICGALSSGNF